MLRFSSQHVQLVSKAILREEKGIDTDFNAPADFSDDEEERKYRRGLECGEISN